MLLVLHLGYILFETSLKRLTRTPCSMMDNILERPKVIGRLLEIRNHGLGTDLPESTHHCEKGMSCRCCFPPTRRVRGANRADCSSLKHL